jgi:hypothetical protein
MKSLLPSSLAAERLWAPDFFDPTTRSLVKKEEQFAKVRDKSVLLVIERYDYGKGRRPRKDV